MSNNEFKGSIPTEMGNMISMVSLHLESNEFGGFIPSELGLLTNLRSLKLANNTLSGTIPISLSSLKLASLSLHSNQLEGSVPFGLCTLSDRSKLNRLAVGCGVTCGCCQQDDDYCLTATAANGN
uniref:Uncharacterized protein n=2 Tax=Cyclophora tenuis TaxID=216820 RepID=A0A7S1GRL3_CYCTE|mmetsp:Transcript_992/g.1811  ORF Transcript_992/g.1811 Transcript_992/m.1811 type:complete len:125 (+) Transcript_992:94-468(+)